jgi:methionyl aminopeptidase
MFTRVKTDTEIENMRIAGGMLAHVLQTIDKEVVAGMTGKDVSEICKRELKKLGGKPSFLGYGGFPDVICISANDEIVHGIPKDTPFKEGDLVSFDYGVTYGGMVTDSAFSKFIGAAPSKDAERLLKTTEQSMYAGIDALKNGVRVGDIAAAIERVLKREKLGIVRELVGHGVGHELHEDPNIPNYGVAGTGPKLSAGMTIAIEPMATLGAHSISVDDDGWTIRTRDHSLAAHFEHTILITNDGYEILTAWK